MAITEMTQDFATWDEVVAEVKALVEGQRQRRLNLKPAVATAALVLAANGIARATSDDAEQALAWLGSLTVLLCRNFDIEEEADEAAEEAVLVTEALLVN